MSKKRGSFSGGLGFVFAAAGSAVGLGNLWRFPYYAAKYGGGTFIFIYIILALTFGFSLLTAEIAIGRKTKLSPILAYKKLCSKFSFLGYLATLVPIIIIPYYCVIGGWVTKYMCVYAQGLVAPAAQDNFFSDFISDPLSPIVFFLIFMLLSAVVIMLGVNKGIERLSKFLMPVLLVLTVGISIYTLTLPNAMEGVSYYLIPDFSKLSIWTFAAALGQLFFSLSIAMGIMVTYGSYTKDEVNLTKSVNQIEIFDTAVALLAGLMVVPAVYVFSGEEGLGASGPGLMFIYLPALFKSMPGGHIIAMIFFVAVFFAGLSSLINLYEAPIATIQEKLGLNRKLSCGVIAGIGVIVSICIQGIVSGWMDVLSIYICPLGAGLAGIMFFWVCGKKYVEEQVNLGREKKFTDKFLPICKYVYCPICILVLILGIALGGIG